MKELTKNRAALLILLLTNPERAFYLQEIGRILNKKPGNFQRTINKMVKEGILVSEYKANARYFKANKEYPLYKEIKSIVFKTIGVVGSIKNVLNKFKAIRFSFIYGSYAKGKEEYLSDIDLVIVGRVDDDKLIRELDKLEGLLKREINYKLFTLNDFRKTIRQNDPFLLSILKDRKIMIIGNENDLREIIKS